MTGCEDWGGVWGEEMRQSFMRMN